MEPVCFGKNPFSLQAAKGALAITMATVMYCTYQQANAQVRKSILNKVQG